MNPRKKAFMRLLKRHQEDHHREWGRALLQYYMKRVDAFGQPIDESPEDDKCCEDLILRHEYARYHRFFLFSPMFLILTLAVAFFASRGALPKESYTFLMAIIVLVVIKEIIGVIVSRRIYNQILKPVEELKKGLFEVSRGNYGVEVRPSRTPEIADLIEAFNWMSLQLRTSELEKAKYETNRKELITSISHDLKTPITTINGFVEGILEGVADTPDKQVSYMQVIQQNARYMNRLIDDLLLYSKLDLHKLNFECVPLNIKAYIEDLFMEMSLEQEEHEVAMTLTDEMTVPLTLSIDPRLMTRAIRNIVSNAIVHGRAVAPIIHFELRTGNPGIRPDTDVCGSEVRPVLDDQWVTLTISDNGPGIPEDQVKKIFERFYRGDDARRMVSGSSGLGLAIAKEIVETHGGVIWARSTLGEGTLMGISLPLKQEGYHDKI